MSNFLFYQDEYKLIPGEKWIDKYLWLSSFTNKKHIISRDKSIKMLENNKNIINPNIIINMIKKGIELL